MKKVLGCLRKAAEEFHMLHDSDHIAVGVSGGKDSILLLYALWLYRKYMKLNYKLTAITVDLGLDGFDLSQIRPFIESLDIPYHVCNTQIAQIVFDIRKEKNPCALCSKMRKGAFYRTAKKLGANKAAFAHTQDDLMETLLMSIFYEGKLRVFSPVTYLDRSDITLIRPFLYLEEKEVISQVRKLGLPTTKNPCPVNHQTKREEIKQLIKSMLKQNPQVRQNILSAIRNTQNYELWDTLSF